MLNNIDRKNPFIVPQNYFENINDQILHNLPSEELEVTKKVSLFRPIAKWASIAAVISGLLFLGVDYFQDDTRVNFGVALSSANEIGKESVAIEDEYYLFLEDQAARIAYKDDYYSDDTF
ncbi:MAG: hypothetical protein RL662_1717 [Bacteroidota bacterium]|jgi:hypothetical protein